MSFASVLLALVLLAGQTQPIVNETHKASPFTITGRASWYQCTAGWCDGTPTVALPEALGGRYTGHAHGTITVCADRCADILVVDYCQCYWGTENQRVVDLNKTAWLLVTNEPYSAGIIKVTLINGKEQYSLPDTGIMHDR